MLESNEKADMKKNMDEKNFTRKRIINRIRCSNYGLEDIDKRKEREAEGPLFPPPCNHLTSGPRPLSKILDRLHSINPIENAYVSISDSLYQSLQNNNKPLDDNNNNTKEVKNVCPVLVANILATHAETFRHALMRHCDDCKEYADSLQNALPYLEPKVFSPNTQCSLHGNVSDAIVQTLFNL